jgi:hypothetical protein
MELIFPNRSRATHLSIWASEPIKTLTFTIRIIAKDSDRSDSTMVILIVVNFTLFGYISLFLLFILECQAKII